MNDNLNMENSRQEKLENSRRPIKDSEKALYDLLDELSVLTKSQDDIEETNDRHR